MDLHTAISLNRLGMLLGFISFFLVAPELLGSRGFHRLKNIFLLTLKTFNKLLTAGTVLVFLITPFALILVIPAEQRQHFNLGEFIFNWLATTFGAILLHILYEKMEKAPHPKKPALLKTRFIQPLISIIAKSWDVVYRIIDTVAQWLGAVVILPLFLPALILVVINQQLSRGIEKLDNSEAIKRFLLRFGTFLFITSVILQFLATFTTP